jgi:NTP pyrophosphatase (non-canonical NTP hydrolase)
MKKHFIRKDDVIQWAVDRSIVQFSTVRAQLLKTQEELDELKAAVAAVDLGETIDGVGDVLVTLIIAAHMAGLDIDQCFSDQFGYVTAFPTRLTPARVEWRLAWSQKWLNELVAAVGSDSSSVPGLIALVAGGVISVAACAGSFGNECLEAAWQEIKDRKGYLGPNGIFVKA